MSEQFASLCLEPPTAPRVTMAEIAARIAEKHRITVADLKGPALRRAVSRPRQEAMFECRMSTIHSTTVIGKFFGGRDHTTVIYGVRAHADRLEQLELSDG